MKKSLFFAVLLTCSACLQIAAQESPVPPPPVGPTTTMIFDQPVYNFGEISPGDKVYNLFRFTNTGKRPLVIANATGSCGCTVPSWPKYPIGPGETAAIVAEFDSKGKSGAQNKTITLTANTSPPQTVLNMKGEILEKPAVSHTAQTQPVQLKQDATKKQLTIELKDAVGPAAFLEIFDANGELIRQEAAQKVGANTIRTDLSGLPVGFYFLSVKNGEKDRTNVRFEVGK